MKVLDLQCHHRHVFEGWFASEDEFQSQLVRGLVACPVCSDTAVVKMLSAPRLNLGASKPEVTTSKPVAASGTDQAIVKSPEAELQATWLKMVHHVIAHTEDVGSQFAEEARKIHYGEVPERGIRGQASAEETQSLREEGIAVMPLPVPAGLTGPLQ